MTLGPRVCSTISPTTLAPATCGAPIVAGLAVEQRENFVESHLRPGFAVERHDGDLVVGGDLVLLAAGLDDCEHRFLRVQPGSAREPARPASLQCEPAGFRPASPRTRKSKSAAEKPRVSGVSYSGARRAKSNEMRRFATTPARCKIAVDRRRGKGPRRGARAADLDDLRSGDSAAARPSAGAGGQKTGAACGDTSAPARPGGSPSVGPTRRQTRSNSDFDGRGRIAARGALDRVTLAAARRSETAGAGEQADATPAAAPVEPKTAKPAAKARPAAAKFAHEAFMVASFSRPASSPVTFRTFLTPRERAARSAALTAE